MKQRRDSLAEFEKIGLWTLVYQALHEIPVVERNLPKQLSEEEKMAEI